MPVYFFFLHWSMILGYESMFFKKQPPPKNHELKQLKKHEISDAAGKKLMKIGFLKQRLPR